jgi:hypothetical protein
MGFDKIIFFLNLLFRSFFSFFNVYFLTFHILLKFYIIQYFTNDQLEVVKLFFISEMKNNGIVIEIKLRKLEGLCSDVNYFTYNSVEYYVFF